MQIKIEPRKKHHPLNISQLIALVFIGIIAVGTILLCLPVASRSGTSCGFRIAWFTATSATCVTGLSLVDTWTQWSGFGQVTILAMIEIGGLGFMSLASFFIFTLRRKVNMNQQMVIAQSIGAEDMTEVIQIQKLILCGSLSIEALGALILGLYWTPRYGFLRAIRLGVFHSVSAFCNAGFDIFGFEKPGSSLILFGQDPVVLLVISALIILGGLGFVVWEEILHVRNVKKWSVYTKLVLCTTAALLLIGTVMTCLLEWRNPATLGELTIPKKILAGFFQSVTTRTAGFAGIDQGALTEESKAFTLLLMVIGGSSGSTAGGLKTVTFIVLVLFLWTRMRGRETVHIFHRTIPNKQVLNAVTISGLMMALSFVGGTLICATSPGTFIDGLYEAVSAIATVGLSTGITSALSLPAQILVIVFMYFGRVGILTVSLGFISEKKSKLDYKYAQTNLLIG